MGINLLKCLSPLLIIFSISCKPDCGTGKYNLFEGTVTFSPQKDSIKVGDTLWLNSYVPLNLKDDIDSQSFNISGSSQMEYELEFASLISAGHYNGAIDSFLIIPTIGTMQNNNSSPKLVRTVFFQENSLNYALQFAIVPLKRGIYCLSTTDIFAAKKNCFSAQIAIREKNSDAHLNYLGDIYYNGSPIDNFDSIHAYCFKVY